MSFLFILTGISVFLTIFIESVFLILQLKGKKMTQWFGKHAFLVHASITLLLWTVMFMFFILLQFEEHPLFHNELIIKIAGLVVLAGGLVVAIWGFMLLGVKRSLCLNFYEDDVDTVESSLYKYISNPEDFGLWAILIGFALITGSVFNLLIALEFIVVMLPHQKLENIPLSK